MQSECINAGTQGGKVDYFALVEMYYSNIAKGTNLMNKEELECYEQLMYIAEKSKIHELIEWKGKVYLLSHTGNKEDP